MLKSAKRLGICLIKRKMWGYQRTRSLENFQIVCRRAVFVTDKMSNTLRGQTCLFKNVLQGIEMFGEEQPITAEKNVYFCGYPPSPLKFSKFGVILKEGG